MKVREFWLTNADDVKYSLMPRESYLHEPQGLGYSVSINAVKIGNTDYILNENYNLGSFSGDLCFMGLVPDVYQEYQNFLNFLAKKPITLHYLPPNTFKAYRCAVRVNSVQKSEVNYEDGVLHCPIQMYRLGLWYDDDPNIIDADTGSTGGKTYPLALPYSYGAIATSNILLSNNGMADTPMVVEIFGTCTDPAFNLFDTENNQYGACKILGTYDYVRVNSDDIDESIRLERNGSVIANAVNYQDLTVGSPNEIYVTFLKLKAGDSILSFVFDANFSGSVRITWRNAYVSV